MNSVLHILNELFFIKNKYIVFNLVARNLKLKYRKSSLGVVWTILIPAATALVYYFVFQKIMKVSIENYLLFILCGVLPWSFFNASVMQGLESIVGNHSLLSKIPISPSVFPFSEALTAFVNLIMAFPVFIVVFFVSNVAVSINILFLPLYLFILFVQAYFIGLFLAIAFVYLRDLRHVMAIVMQLWFYLTPILYESEMIPDSFKKFQYLNPISFAFNGIHDVVLRSKIPKLSDLFVMLFWTGGIVILSSTLYFKKKSKIVESI